VPHETTIFKFRHLLERHEMGIPVPRHEERARGYHNHLFNLMPQMAYGYIRHERNPNLTPEQASPVISDVRDYFWKHQNEAPEPPFRTIEQSLTERIAAETSIKTTP
jgi:hypothetical protein